MASLAVTIAFFALTDKTTVEDINLRGRFDRGCLLGTGARCWLVVSIPVTMRRFVFVLSRLLVLPFSVSHLGCCLGLGLGLQPLRNLLRSAHLRLGPFQLTLFAHAIPI